VTAKEEGQSRVTGRQMKTTEQIILRGGALAFFVRKIDKSHENHLISGYQLRYPVFFYH
jgi:hypothetical protein